MAIEPVTREESFLATAGGRSVTPPTPITRKEQLLQGIIDAVKSGGATPDVIKGAVNDYLNANPVKPGATTEQAAQIEQNKTDIADLQSEIEDKQPKGDYVKTVNGNKPDATGNVVVATGGNGSGQNPSQGGGMSAAAASLLITILRDCATYSPQTANIDALEALLTAGAAPDAPPHEGVTQTGSVLTITSGVAATQDGSTLNIA